MSRSMPTMRDTIDDEACAWLVRVESGELGTHGQADFDAWINADPRHAAAYRAVLRTWQDIPALPELADLCSAPARSGAKARKALIAVGLAAVAAAAAVVVAILAGSAVAAPMPLGLPLLARVGVASTPPASTVGPV